MSRLNSHDTPSKLRYKEGRFRATYPMPYGKREPANIEAIVWRRSWERASCSLLNSSASALKSPCCSAFVLPPAAPCIDEMTIGLVSYSAFEQLGCFAT